MFLHSPFLLFFWLDAVCMEGGMSEYVCLSVYGISPTLALLLFSPCPPSPEKSLLYPGSDGTAQEDNQLHSDC